MVGFIDVSKADRTTQTFDQFEALLYWCITVKPHTLDIWAVWELVVLMYYRQPAHPRPQMISLMVGFIDVSKADRTTQNFDQFEALLYWCITVKPHTLDIWAVWELVVLMYYRQPAHPRP